MNTNKSFYLWVVSIFAVGTVLLASGCGLIVASVIPKGEGATTTITLPSGGVFQVSGTVSRGTLVVSPTIEGAVLLFKNKSDLQSKSAPPVSAGVKSFTGDTFTYSIGTTEGGTYFIIAAYPFGDVGTPEGAGGPGITADSGANSMINALQPITLNSQSTTVNITLYRITGP